MRTTMRLHHSTPPRTGTPSTPSHALCISRIPRLGIVAPRPRLFPACAAAPPAQEEGSDTEDDPPLSEQQQQQLDALAATLVQRAADFARASDVGAAAYVLMTMTDGND